MESSIQIDNSTLSQQPTDSLQNPILQQSQSTDIEAQQSSAKSTDPKKNCASFSQYPHFWYPIVPAAIFILFAICFCWFYVDRDAPKWNYPVYAFCLGTFLAIACAYIYFEKIYYYGISGFYETFWFCNISLVMCVFGILLRLPTLIGMTCIMVFFPHFGFYFDSICYLLIRKTPFGAAGFFFDKQWPLHNKLASLHHFWYIPCICVLLYHMPYFSYWSYILSIIYFSYFQIMCHYCIPLYAPNPDGTERFLNVDISYVLPDCLKNIFPFRLANGRPIICLFLVGFFFYALPVNGIAWAVVYFIQYLLNL